MASRAELRTLAALSAANWQPPDQQVTRFDERAAPALLAAACPLWLYVGYLGDPPVATAELTVAGASWGSTTSRPWRSSGGAESAPRSRFGRCSTLANAATGTAVLQAAPAAIGLYERVGFRPFGEIAEYKPERGQR